MDGITTIEPLTAKAKISEQEMARRRKAVRQVDASNRIEGIYRGQETDAVIESFVCGEIELTDLVVQLTAPPAVR